ncbi:MAG: succinate dehydrogenase, cytochrome b556 subunit [Thiobacillaceae bacterium]
MNKRPVYLNLLRLRLPLMAWVSILHRVTGVLLFLALPVGLYLLQTSLSGQAGYAATSALLGRPVARFVIWLMLGSLANHALAGLRHFAMDLHCGVERNRGRSSARLVLIAGVFITLAAGWELFR